LLAYFAGAGLLWVLFTLAVLVDLGCVVILGHDFFLHIFGIATVRRDGSAARRLRLLWRNALAWGFVFLAAPAAFLWWTVLTGLAPGSTSVVVFAFVLPSLVLAATVFVIWKPARGLQDHLSGTFLVPR